MPATEVITEQIGRQYFVMAFLVVLGALQIAASIPGIRGMMILPGRIPTRFLGGGLIVLGIVLFYLMPLWVDGPWAAGSVESDSTNREWGRAAWSDLGAARNVNDVDGGLSGTDHARWFPMAMALALITSACRRHCDAVAVSCCTTPRGQRSCRRIGGVIDSPVSIGPQDIAACPTRLNQGGR